MRLFHSCSFTPDGRTLFDRTAALSGSSPSAGIVGLIRALGHPVKSVKFIMANGTERSRMSQTGTDRQRTEARNTKWNRMEQSEWNDFKQRSRRQNKAQTNRSGMTLKHSTLKSEALRPAAL